MAGVLAGRMDDFTNASIDEFWWAINGKGLSGQRWIGNMHSEGKTGEISADAVSGAVAGVTGKWMNDVLISLGMMDSPATKATLQGLQRQLSESTIRWDVGLKSYVIQYSSRRVHLSQSDWESLLGATNRELYVRLSDILSTLFGTKAKEEYKEIPEVEGL